MPTNTASTIAHSRTTSALNEASIVLSLFLMRLVAGILENFGVPHLSEIAALIMLAGLAILFLHRMRIAQSAGLFLAGILAWVLSGALSYAANPAADAQATVMLLTLLLLYGLFANAAATYLRDRSGLTIASRILIIFIIGGFALSLFQILSNSGFVAQGRDTTQRAFGSDVHPVSFAIQLVAALSALEIIRLKKGRPASVFHIAVMAMGLVAIYLTFARTAWVMGAVVIGLSVILRGKFARRVSMAALATIIGLSLLFTSQRFADLGNLPVFMSNFSIHDAVFDWRYVDNSISWRIVNWSIGLQQAQEQPWLGFGPGQSAVSSFFNLEMHNVFLEVFFEGGVIGLFALLLTLAGLFRMHRHLPTTTPADRKARIVANGFGLSLLFAVTFSTSFVDQLMSFLLYQILLACAGASSNQQRDGRI